MKKKSLTENFLYNVIYQVLVTALPIITTPYTTRVLGLRVNGFHSYTETIVTYFILIGFLGTALYGTRKIAYVRDNPVKLTQVTWDLILLRLFLMVLTLCVYIPTLCINNEFAYLYRIQIINIVANGIDLSWFFQGVEDFKKVTLRNMVVKLIYVVLLFTIIRSPNDLSKYVLLIVGSALFGNVVMWFFIKDYLQKNTYQKSFKFIRYLKGSVALFLPQITNYIYALLDRSMLKWITGSTDYVTIYDQGQRLIRAITAVMQSISYVMMARLSNLKASNDHDQIKSYIHKSLNLTLFFAFPIMFGLFATAEDFIPIFLGKEYLQTIPVLKLISPLALTLPVNSVLGVQLLLSIGKEKQYTVATTVGAVVNIVINMALISNTNVVGACISSLAAEFSVMLICLKSSKGYINIKKVIKDNWFPFIASALIVGIVYLVKLININAFLSLLLEVGLSVIFYFGIMIISKNEVIISLKSKIINKIFKRGGNIE